VPTGYDLGVNVAVETYDGKLFFGLIADAQVASDVNRLRDFLNIAFEELRQAASAGPGGATKVQRRGRRTRPAATRTASPEARPTSVRPAPGLAATAPTVAPLTKAKHAA